LTKLRFLRGEFKIEAIFAEKGFRKNIRKRVVILALRTIIEKRIRKEKLTYITFVDLEKANDNDSWLVMFKILESAGIEYT